MLKLIVDSDLHFGQGHIRADKSNHAALIPKIVRDEGVDAVICAGDLTERGWDGKNLLCWHYGGTDNQVAPLKQFIAEIEADVPVYICEGNHDQYVPWPYFHKGVKNLVKERHGGRIYSWGLKKDNIKYHFVCLGVYPDEGARAFLRRELESHPGDYIVIYFHYNVDGAYSDWWSVGDKTAFVQILEPHRARISAIIVGHLHANYHKVWNGYNIISGAGSNVLMTTINETSISTREY